jgi:hypothetical protein
MIYIIYNIKYMIILYLPMNSFIPIQRAALCRRFISSSLGNRGRRTTHDIRTIRASRRRRSIRICRVASVRRGYWGGLGPTSNLCRSGKGGRVTAVRDVCARVKGRSAGRRVVMCGGRFGDIVCVGGGLRVGEG